MRLENKVACVTGAASGIGKAIAEKFIDEGAKVVFSDINPPVDFKETESIFFVKCDVSKTADIQELISKTIQKFGKLDIMVNNAGVALVGDTLNTTEEAWDKTISIDLKGVWLGTKYAVPEIAKQGKGKIINTASIAGLVGFQGTSAYCAAKGAVVNLTREMALDLAAQKINVNAIAPGIIKTNMTKDILADPKTANGMLAQTPIGRLGEPEDIAYLAVYLASDESDFMTGQTIAIDGGWTIK